jgi:peptidoglycan lytic transglycosylase
MKTGVLVILVCSLALDVFGQNLSPATNQVVSANPPAPMMTPPLIPPYRQLAIPVQMGFASWYGEDHRGRRMANGRRFDPDQLTAASWFYPLGTRVRVILKTDPRVLNSQSPRSVWVTITDRGPHHRLVRNGRIIDLSYEVFRRLADPGVGLVEVIVHPEARQQQVALRSPG